MSRIEEALRRASLATLEPAVENVRRGSPPVPVPASVVAPPPPAAVSPRYAEVERPAVVVPPESVDTTTVSTAAEPATSQADRIEDAVGETLIGNAKASRTTRLDSAVDGKLIGNAELPAVVGEQYRKLGAVLHQLQAERGVKIVMVASAMAEEGKTLTAANLALTLSESFRRRVLLVDADLRRPTIHKLFRISNVSGLNDGLKAEQEQKLTVIEISPRLSILPAGRPDPDPMSGLTSDRMRTIVTQAGEEFDWVVLDTPPVGLLPDAKLLAEMVHAVVFVIRAGTTPFRVIDRAVAEIDRKRIVGVVLNRVTEAAMPSHYYEYYGETASAS
jgi:capsular exopolysaccharide synthesis family protein